MGLSEVRNMAGQLFHIGGGSPCKVDVKAMALLTAVLLCVTAPLELSQVAFALAGALVYAMIQAVQTIPTRQATAARVAAKTADDATCGGAAKKRSPSPCGTPPQRAHSSGMATPSSTAAAPRRPAQGSIPRPCELAATLPGNEFRTPSSQPVTAPTFAASGFDAEVEELVGHIAPTAAGDLVVQQLANMVKAGLARIIPEAEVSGFASGDLLRGTAFGVAVPEVEIVISVNPSVLAARLQGRLAPRSPCAAHLDVRKLQKSAIRACTDRLVSAGGFKFRRSAFRGQEPKVTLLAPVALGIFSEAIPFDFSVNSVTPLYNAALLTECGHMDRRAKELILLVKRWAKDRGICHTAKGHLSPYSWSLLAIYYLQVARQSFEGPLLPALEGFAKSAALAGLAPGGGTAPKAAVPQGVRTAPQHIDGPRATVATLFRGFASFYARDFDWRNEAVSVRLGRRAQPDLALPLHIIIPDGDEGTTVGPSIEDPFERKRNLGQCATAASLARMHEELHRADELCRKDTSLTNLLEPWVPPERGSGREEDEEEEGEEVHRKPHTSGAATPIKTATGLTNSLRHPLHGRCLKPSYEAAGSPIHTQPSAGLSAVRRLHPYLGPQ